MPVVDRQRRSRPAPYIDPKPGTSQHSPTAPGERFPVPLEQAPKLLAIHDATYVLLASHKQVQ